MKKWTCFEYLCFRYVYRRALLTLIWKVVFCIPTNYDSDKFPPSTLPQFVILAIRWQFESHRKEIVFCLSTWECTTTHFWYEGDKWNFGLCRCYLNGMCLCILIITTNIRYQGNPHERLQWLCEYVLRTWEYNPLDFGHCVDKLQQSQIATTQKTLPSQFVILSLFVIHAFGWEMESNHTKITCSLYLGRVPLYTFDMNMSSWVFIHFCIICLWYNVDIVYNYQMWGARMNFGNVSNNTKMCPSPQDAFVVNF